MRTAASPTAPATTALELITNMFPTVRVRLRDVAAHHQVAVLLEWEIAVWEKALVILAPRGRKE